MNLELIISLELRAPSGDYDIIPQSFTIYFMKSLKPDEAINPRPSIVAVAVARYLKHIRLHVEGTNFIHGFRIESSNTSLKTFGFFTN